MQMTTPILLTQALHHRHTSASKTEKAQLAGLQPARFSAGTQVKGKSLLSKAWYSIKRVWHGVQYFCPSIFALCTAWLIPTKGIQRWMETLVLYKPNGPSNIQALHSTRLKKSLKDVYFKTTDGEKLHGWHAAAQPGKETIVFSHGNFGNMNVAESVLEALIARGYGVLAYDYRGYGNSTGKSHETGLYKDLEAASQFLTQLKDCPVPVSNQIAVGVSLGGSVTAHVATKIPFKAILIAGTCTSFPSLIQNLRERWYIPRWLFPLEKRFQQKFDTASKMSKLLSPVIIAHGAKDRFVPIAMGEILYKRVPKNQKRMLVIIPNGGHSNLFVAVPGLLLNRFESLLKALPAKPA